MGGRSDEEKGRALRIKRCVWYKTGEDQILI